MKIRLETNDGGLVHETEIPPFNEAPAVILWGIRVFDEFEEDGDTKVYREVFAYHLVDNPNTTS